MKKIELSKRLKSLPPYLFAEIDREKQVLKKKGINLIDLSIFSYSLSRFWLEKVKRLTTNNLSLSITNAVLSYDPSVLLKVKKSWLLIVNVVSS